jgi:hypothetical protein
MSSAYEALTTLEEWAGSQDLNLTLLFTDIVDSTAIGIKPGESQVDRRFIFEFFTRAFASCPRLSALSK